MNTKSFPLPNLSWLCASLRERPVLYRRMAVGQFIHADVYLQNTDNPNVFRIVRVINRIRANITPKNWILADIGRLNIVTEECELFEEAFEANTTLFGVRVSSHVTSSICEYEFVDTDHSRMALRKAPTYAYGNFPILLNAKNNTITLKAPFVRTKNKAAWLALNKQIRDVRDAFVIRAKLGAFSEDDFRSAFHLYSHVLTQAPHVIIGEYIYSAVSEFNACEEATYKLFLALIYQRNQYSKLSKTLKEEFETAIKLYRPSIYTAAGVLSLAEEGSSAVESSSPELENEDDGSDQSMVALSSDDV